MLQQGVGPETNRRKETATRSSATRTATLLFPFLQGGRPCLNAEEQRAAKHQVLAAFERGCSVQERLRTGTVPLHRATVSRLRQRYDAHRGTALHDGRHGHVNKLRREVRAWRQEEWQSTPGCNGQTVQNALYERFAIHVSKAHLTRVRASLRWSRRRGGVEQKSAHALV